MVSVPVELLADVAVMVAVVVLATVLVFTGNVPLLEPSGIVIVVGTVAEPVSLVKVTTAPPGPAGELNVTVPVEIEPPATGFGVNVTPVMVPWPEPFPPGLIIRVAAFPLFTERTMISAVVDPVTELALIGNVTDFCPAGITTTAGTAAAPLLLLTNMNAPGAGAGSATVTVPEATPPPLTVDGEMVNDTMVGLFPWPPTTMNDPCPVAPLPLAVTVTIVGCCKAGTVKTGNVALDWPAGMVIENGTGEFELSELSETCNGSDMSNPAAVTVPVAVSPPVIGD
jgi:hypothetical protein